MSTRSTMAHRQRMIADQILDRIAHDPALHQQLLDNTAPALQAAGFTQALQAAEVAGYAAPNMVCSKPTCLSTCGPVTCMFTIVKCVQGTCGAATNRCSATLR